MAARGELVVVGHPAPRAATESFDGNIVAAQLGNPALGLAGVVVASLTGLREDHGQCGVDSLVLGLVPLAAWGALTGALDGAGRTARADLLLWSPCFAAWGVAWTAAARRSSGRLNIRLGCALHRRVDGGEPA